MAGQQDGGVYVVGAGLAGLALRLPPASTRAWPPPCWRRPTGSAAGPHRPGRGLPARPRLPGPADRLPRGQGGARLPGAGAATCSTRGRWSAPGWFVTVADPFRRRWDGLRTALAPVGGLGDKLKVAGSAPAGGGRVAGGAVRLARDHHQEALAADGFSEVIVDRFFRPLFGGVLLDRELGTSSRMFEFVYRMFALGDVALLTRGMGAIGQQLAGGLPPDRVRLGQRVTAVGDGGLTPRRRGEAAGQGGGGRHRRPYRLRAARRRAAGTRVGRGYRLYFAADRAPVDEPVIVLDGDGEGPGQQPLRPQSSPPPTPRPGAALISAAVLHRPGLPKGPDLEAAVLGQLADWFRLRRGRLAPPQDLHDPPRPTRPALRRPRPPERPVRLRPACTSAADHRDNASINGALASGRRTADAVLEDL